MPQKIEITTGNIFRVVTALLVLLFLFLIRDVVLIFFVALVIVSALGPAVDWLQNKKIPRILSTFSIFVIGLGLVGLLGYFIAPPLIQEISELVINLPAYLSQLPFQLKADYIQNILEKVPGFLITVPSKISSIIVILIIAFYLLAQKHGIRKILKAFTPAKHQDYVFDLFDRIQKKISFWFLGQLTSCLFVGILTFIGLFLLKMPYALLLAIIVGISEIVPFGPIIGFIPAAILGFAQSSLTGILVGILYLVIHQIENHIIVPQVMRKAIGLNPVLIILALLIGAKLAGILGLLIAIPSAAALSVLIKDFMNKGKRYDQ